MAILYLKRSITHIIIMQVIPAHHHHHQNSDCNLIYHFIVLFSLTIVDSVDISPNGGFRMLQHNKGLVY